MINKIKSVIKGDFIKNVLVVMTGTALAQVITFALMPIITRIYGPNPMGILGTFTSVVTILSSVAALTYPIAIVLPKKSNKARIIVKLSLVISFSLALLLTLILLLFSEQVIDIFKLDVISNFIFLIPIFVLLTGISQIMEQWLIRTKEFRVMARTSVMQSLFINFSKFGVGYAYPLSISLIFIQTIGVFFKVIIMFFMSNKSIINKNKKHSLKDFKHIIFKYRDFPMYRAPQGLINAISQGLPVILFAAYFGPAVAGFYAIGRQALNTPVQLLGKAVQDVFYPKINELAVNSKEMTPVILKSIIGLFLLGIIPFSIIILYGPVIFSFIFGEDWLTAGEYARWIALVSFSMLITRPIIVTIPVLGIQRFYLVVEFLGTIGKTGAIFIGIYLFKEAMAAVALFSVASILMYVFLMFYTLFESRKFDRLNIKESLMKTIQNTKNR